MYKNKRVCVTGGAGFVGVQLVKLLVDAGARVFVLDDNSRGKNTVESWSVDYIAGDATNPDTCNYAFRGGNVRGVPVDAVFNLAATVAGVLHNVNHHLEMFESNIGLQTVPLMVAEEIGVQNFLQVSSVCVYSPGYNHPSIEYNGHVGKPHIANAGYALSKRMGEEMVQLSNVKKAVIVRPSNVFGPMDYFDDKAHVIPALIKRAVSDSQMDLYGPGEYVREFIYSEDVARGMMVAMEHGKDKEAYNIGTNGETRITMLGLAELILDKVGSDKPVALHPSKGGGDSLRWSSSEKLQALGWRHSWTLDRGLEETIKWYKTKKNPQ